MASPVSPAFWPTSLAEVCAAAARVPESPTPRAATRASARAIVIMGGSLGQPPALRNAAADRLLDHPVRPLQERAWDRQAESAGGLDVDDQVELFRPLDRQLTGARAPQD